MQIDQVKRVWQIEEITETDDPTETEAVQTHTVDA